MTDYDTLARALRLVADDLETRRPETLDLLENGELLDTDVLRRYEHLIPRAAG